MGNSAMWNTISLVRDLNTCRRVHFLRRSPCSFSTTITITRPLPLRASWLPKYLQNKSLEIREKKWVTWWKGTHGRLGCFELVHCRGEAATICSAITLVSSRALNEAYARRSPGKLTDWSSGSLIRTGGERCPSHWRMWSTCFDF